MSVEACDMPRDWGAKKHDEYVEDGGDRKCGNEGLAQLLRRLNTLKRGVWTVSDVL